jgi:hypothetical protein
VTAALSSGERLISRRVLIELAAPRGFGAAYRRAAADPERPEVLSDLLALVGYSVSPETIAGWPEVKRCQAEVHAVNVHLRASDNILQAHPRPSWMPEPWQGSPEGDGVFEGPGGTRL